MTTSRLTFNDTKLKQLIAGRRKVIVAREIGIQRQLLDYYLRGGMPSVENLYRLADHFKVKPDALINRPASKSAAA